MSENTDLAARDKPPVPSLMDYTADPALYNYKLVEALHAGDKDMLKRLINAQASTNESSALASGAASIRSHNENYRQSPLHIAVQIVPLDLVKYLLSFNQLDVNQRDADGNTPLHLAAKTGRVDVVRELLDRKDVDISLRNDEDQMAVDIARGVDIVDMIVEYRNDIVNQIAPHVHQAASKGDLEQVKRLLEDPRAGALDINHQNPMTGRTALHEATVAGNADLVRYLLRKGADPFIRDKKNKTALELTKAEAIKSALKESFNDAVLATIPGEVPRMQGSLYKWTNFASGYKLRYFVLENGILSYYKNQEDAGNACRGSINIGTANIWMDSGDKTRFDILGKGSVRYHLRSEHATEAKRWIMALTQSKQWVQESLALPNTPISSNTSTPAVGTLRPLHAVQQTHGISTPLNAPMHSTNLGIDMAVTESDERRRQQAAQRISPNVERTPSIISTGGGSITGVDLETESVQDSSQTMGKSASTPDILVTRSPQSDDSAFASNNGGEPPYGDQLNLTFQAATVQLDVQQQLLHSVEATVASIVGADTDIARRCDMVSKGLSNSLEALRRLLESAKHMSEDREVYWRARCDAEAERQRLWEASLKQVATEREEMFETLTSVKDIARKSGVFEVSAAINGPVIERECEEFEDEDEFFDATEEGFIFEEVLSGEVSTVTSPRARRSLSLSHPSIGELRGKAAEGETGVSADAIVEALTEEIETDNELALSFRGYPMNASDFRTELPPPDNAAPSISIWSVLKNSIGKDLTKISMPVIFNEPTSMLQRMCEDIEYIDLLDTAVCQRGSAERMLYVAAFAISNYSSTLGRIAKPFNPLLGETFEYVRPDKNYRYISEQVSHHPPISACHCDSPNYSFFAEVNVRSKFMGNTLEMHPSGVSHLVLKVPKEYVQDDATNEEDNNGGDTTDKRSVDTEGATAGRVDEHYSWTKCVTAVNNLILGRLTIEHYGDMPITNHLTGETCMLTFKQRGWRGKDEHVIEGSLKDRHGRVLYELLGKWSDKFIARRVADDDFHLSAPDADGASMGSGGTRGRNFILWRKNPAPETPRPFNLTEFAAGLNDCPDTLRPYLAPTDSRIRPDQHALERGEWDLASQEKTRLEEKQRAKRRERELEDDASGHGTHQARWFRHDIEPDTGAGYWRFTNEYWRERAKAAKAVDAGQQPQWKDVEDIF